MKHHFIHFIILSLISLQAFAAEPAKVSIVCLLVIGLKHSSSSLKKQIPSCNRINKL